LTIDAADLGSEVSTIDLAKEGALEFIEDIGARARVVDRVDFCGTDPTQFVVSGCSDFPKISPLLIEDAALTDQWIIDWHSRPRLPNPVNVNCYFFRNAIVSGRGHVFLDHRLRGSEDLMPSYWRSIIDSGGEGISLDAEIALPARIIDNPCVVFTGHGMDIYGHLLIEMLPRLHIAWKSLRDIIPRCKILLDTRAANWFVDILHYGYQINMEDFEWFTSSKENVMLHNAIVPSYCIRQEHFHPFNNQVYDYLVKLYGQSSDVRRIFVTRAFFNNPHSRQRRCLNEGEIAMIACREFKFTPIAPETFPWNEQIRLFANADVVVGEEGSGMHNAVFSPNGTKVGVIGFGNFIQSCIAALREQRIAYLRTERAPDGNNYYINAELFRSFLRELLAP
jgi:capsular polysaccharide biosynthesis protein